MRRSELISPFRYPGGKSWLAPTVRQWLSTQPRPATFLEPFAGGASVGLAVAAHNLADRVELVELDAGVAAVWQVLLGASDRDADQLARLVAGFEVTRPAVETVLDSEPVGLVDRAFRTLVANRCSHSGVMAPGAGLTRVGEDGRGLGQRWYADTLVRRFAKVRALRGRVSITHGDGLEAIRRSGDAAVFVDPPYVQAGPRLYRHWQLDHAGLFDAVAGCVGPVMMTYDDHPDVRALAAQYGLVVGTVGMKTGHHRRKDELVLTRAPSERLAG